MRKREWLREWTRPTAEQIRTILLLVSLNTSETVIGAWTDEEIRETEWWALHEHLSASDNPVRRYPRPTHLPEPASFEEQAAWSFT